MSEKFIVVDSDTIIVQSCMSVQTNYCVYKDDVFVCQAKSKKQWCIDNAKRDDDGEVISLGDPEGLEFRKEARLVPHSTERQLLARCKLQITKAFGEIQLKYPDRTMIIVLESDGNYREAFYPAYKQQRVGEIILRKKLAIWVGTEFKNVVYAMGQETDDVVSIYGYKGYKDFLKTGEYSYVIASADKDLSTVPSRLYNYIKKTECDITPLEATRFFCKQLLIGDAIDGVSGLNNPISKDLAKQFGVRHAPKGVGDVTATNILLDCVTEKECFERVITCYKDVYGNDWLDKLQYEAFPLRMRRIPNEMYDITNHMKHLGIEIE